jgi:hypothetical protein
MYNLWFGCCGKKSLEIFLKTRKKRFFLRRRRENNKEPSILAVGTWCNDMREVREKFEKTYRGREREL